MLIEGLELGTNSRSRAFKSSVCTTATTQDRYRMGDQAIRGCMFRIFHV